MSTAASTVPPERATVLPHTQLAGDVAFLGPIRQIRVGAITMAFRRFGSGPDLVMISGQDTPMSLWPVATLAALARHHRVTIYDNRDLGNTTRVPEPFTLPDLADDAAGLIAALRMTRPAVFGWSTGGEIGLLLAVRHPESLSALAITGATPGGPKSVLPPESINKEFASKNPDLNVLFDVLFSPTPAGTAAKNEFLAGIAKVQQPDSAPDSAERYDAAERRFWSDPEPDLASISVPVLVMNGDADYAVPPSNARYIAQRIGAHARLELDSGGRHGWFIEHPDHFMELMDSFLR